MLNRLTTTIDKQAEALSLRAQRQQVLASNIANADTPGYKARDIDFSTLWQQSLQPAKDSRLVTTTDPRHLPGLQRGADGSASLTTLKYRQAEQPSLDGNTVDLDRERANFADNTLRYEASLRFVNGSLKKIFSAIRGE